MHTHAPSPFRGQCNDHGNDVDNDDSEENGQKKAAFEPEYSLGWRRRRYVCRAAERVGECLVIPVPGHAGEGLNTYVASCGR